MFKNQLRQCRSGLSRQFTRIVYQLGPDKYYAKFSVNGLMRGDMTTRTAFYHNARQDGWMNANEIRELEDMNRIPAEEGGDVYAVNGNLIPLTAVPMNLPKGATKGAT